MNNQNAKLGVFLTLREPTPKIIKTAKEAGSVEAGGRLMPRLQIPTIGELFRRNKPDLPPVYDIISAIAAARRVATAKRPVVLSGEALRREPPMKLPFRWGERQNPFKRIFPLLSRS